MSTERKGSATPPGLARRFGGSGSTSRLERRVTGSRVPQRREERPEAPKPRKVGLIVGLVVVVVLVIGAVALGLFSRQGSGSPGSQPNATAEGASGGSPQEKGTFSFLPAQDRTEKRWSGFQTFAGDVNGDGRADLIWNETAETNRLYVALGRSDGTFSFLPAQDHSEKHWAGFQTFIGDVNGDGRSDVVWNETAETNRLYVALGRSDGTFSFLPAQDHPEKDWTGFHTLVGDINGDGRADLIWNAASETNRLRVALGGADGTFQFIAPQEHPQRGWDGFKAVVGDVNADGRSDLIWNRAAETNRLYVGLGLADGTLLFLPPQNHPDPGWDGFETLVGDINGDGRADLLWNARQETNRIAVALGGVDGTFQFLPRQEREEKGWSGFVSLVGDVNGDGRTDLLWNELQEANRIYVGLGQADGTFQFLPLQDHPEKGWDNYKVLAADVNGDRRTDLVWNLTQETNRIIVALAKP